MLIEIFSETFVLWDNFTVEVRVLLRKYQLEDKIILANGVFNDAIVGADMRPLVAKARLKKGLPLDPVGEYIKSEYQKKNRVRKRIKISKMTKFKLGINAGFAINRFPEPEVWLRIVGKELDLKYVQFVMDLLNPFLPKIVIDGEVEKIKKYARKYDVKIDTTFTSAFS